MRVYAPPDTFAVRIGVYCRTIKSPDIHKPAAGLHLGNCFLDCGAIPCVKVRRHTGRRQYFDKRNSWLHLAHVGAKIVDIVLHRDLSRADFAKQGQGEVFNFVSHCSCLHKPGVLLDDRKPALDHVEASALVFLNLVDLL